MKAPWWKIAAAVAGLLVLSLGVSYAVRPRPSVLFIVNGKPLAGATITGCGNGVTDAEGRFTVPAGQQSGQVSVTSPSWNSSVGVPAWGERKIEVFTTGGRESVIVSTEASFLSTSTTEQVSYCDEAMNRIKAAFAAGQQQGERQLERERARVRESFGLPVPSD
ncbi:MAG: hypothetical protein AAGB00_12155 [Planctomycetota bacterium]